MKATQENVKKEKQWNVLEQQAKLTVDPLGKPIDKKILPLIVGLWANGVPTGASCEGHLGWGRAYPWVSIEADTPQNWGGLDVYRKDERKRKVKRRRSLKACNAAFMLLNNFYKIRRVPYEHQLVLGNINMFWGDGEIMPLTGELDRRDRAKNLRRFQAEMNAFAAYLRKRFFGTGR